MLQGRGPVRLGNFARRVVCLRAWLLSRKSVYRVAFVTNAAVSPMTIAGVAVVGWKPPLAAWSAPTMASLMPASAGILLEKITEDSRLKTRTAH